LVRSQSIACLCCDCAQSGFKAETRKNSRKSRNRGFFLMRALNLRCSERTRCQLPGRESNSTPHLTRTRAALREPDSRRAALQFLLAELVTKSEGHLHQCEGEHRNAPRRAFGGCSGGEAAGSAAEREVRRTRGASGKRAALREPDSRRAALQFLLAELVTKSEGHLHQC
jgi:hypothetical protein